MIYTDFTTGTLPTWILLALGLFIAWRISKGGGGSAIQELAMANSVLEKRIHALGGEVRDLRIENEHLKTRTDFAQALAPVLEGIAISARASEARQESIMEAQAHHEQRAQDRQEGILKILDLIASRIGEEVHHGD